MDNPIDFITQKITEGINNAVDALEDKSLMIASATFHSNLTMRIPGISLFPVIPGITAPPPDIVTVTTELTIVIGPNPYKENQ